MPLAKDNLLALKTFYFGLLAAQIPASRSNAITMLGSAIEHLTPMSDYQSKVRLAFYYLARAELRRYVDDPTQDRQTAQEICQNIQVSMYDQFMIIQEATTSRTREPKRDGLMSAYGSTSRSDYDILPPGSPHRAWLTMALCALEEKFSNLTPSQIRFLEKVTLAHLFKKHGINNAHQKAINQYF